MCLTVYVCKRVCMHVCICLLINSFKMVFIMTALLRCNAKANHKQPAFPQALLIVCMVAMIMILPDNQSLKLPLHAWFISPYSAVRTLQKSSKPQTDTISRPPD